MGISKHVTDDGCESVEKENLSMSVIEKGTILNDRYKILGIIGQGGMSNVYLVEDQKLQSQWALKEMLDIFPSEEKGEILEQFKKEARILAGLKHPNLPRVFDYFDEENKHYLVMEYLEGLNLNELFEKNPEISPKKVLDWGIQLCDVLESLHREGIIYRDLKPGNVLVDKNNRIYLIDFGIARFFTGGKIHDTVIIGTPGFASPEHHGQAETDARSDIFSLGATLHFLLTRVDPMHIPFLFKNPSEILPDLPAEFSEAIMKAVRMDPSQRFQSANEMKEFLVRKVKPALEGKAPIDPVRTKPHTGKKNVIENVQTFTVDPVKSLAPATVLSGGIVLTAAVIVAGGVPAVPVIVLSAVAVAPVAYLFRSLYKYLFKTPQRLTVILDSKGITFIRNEINMEIPWKDITELLIFQEKTGLGTEITKYKLFTSRGNFEYDGEMRNIKKLNELIIQMAELDLAGRHGEYKRYEKSP
ncbi:MAG: serine/threonine protein kinase [Candidatus Eremiobacteraeota bacterium]|nr:serine/threonine protein kinase [Candidatus Eremiobacteraeota bacterium]